MMNRIDYKINGFDIAKNAQAITVLDYDMIRNHMNQGEINITDDKTSFVGEVRLIQFLSGLFYTVQGAKSNKDEGEFVGLAVWDDSSGFELDITCDESNIIHIINSERQEILFSFDELRSEIKKVMIRLFSDLEKICPEYLLNSNYLEIKSKW